MGHYRKQRTQYRKTRESNACGEGCQKLSASRRILRPILSRTGRDPDARYQAGYD
jgi:hypothetical protein